MREGRGREKGKCSAVAAGAEVSLRRGCRDRSSKNEQGAAGGIGGLAVTLSLL